MELRKRLEENRFNQYVQVLEWEGGLPIAVKDVIDVKGARTTAGSRVMEYVAEEDSSVVRRLKRAGFTPIAKANTHEFAIGATNTSSRFGPTRNPRDPSRITGGSSGGSAAAVAAGDVELALGTDTGGSIRIPAALCGVYGFKPTFGRVSRNGVVPMAWSLDHVGFIGRDLKLIVEAYKASKGYDSKDPSTTLNLSVPEKDRKYRRVGLIREMTEGTEVEKEFMKFVDKLSSTLEVEYVSLQDKGWSEARFVIAAVEAAAYHSKFLPERETLYFPDVISFLRMGMGLRGVDYVNAQRIRSEAVSYLSRIFKSFDLLICPTVKVRPPLLEEVLGKEVEWRVRLVSNTAPFNLTGNPALSVPINEMVGAQMVADLGEDLSLLEFVINTLGARSI
ncbi:amidase [Sulfodiicoccus acidiphilus]|uniref:Amidase n=1 Tax=Sulfodiicoccus acidiphilus TaxID=1670455 RepID=A0A348B1N3_9CREN|nr:amidase [Sulfodiicoccus acidiphilus]BBD72085.1 amidase [Sulfodiicoccus acidiphilus]GGU05042.1 amidase [Sulfodiicoccus acidiphilus]